MEIRKCDKLVEAAYLAAESKQFGTLHQRMKYLIASAAACNMAYDRKYNDVWNAILDLETEVKYHVPARPPFGRRTHRSHHRS